MKKYLYIAGLCLASLFLSSCDDFLTVSSPDQLTSGSFWRNESDAQAGIAAAYSQLEYYIDIWEFAEVKWPVEAYREDIVEMGNDARNYPNWVELYNFTYTNGNSQVSSYWWNNYKGASFANQVIEKVADIPDVAIQPGIREQIINEAYFLRAYYHLKLLLNWEKIIIRDKYITNQSDLNKALSPRTDAWDFIIGDLKKAIALPAAYDADNVGRATKGAAYAYLGFAYLTRAYEEPGKKSEYLTKALEALNEVKGYSLVKSFSSMFDATNKNSKESIFELQTSMSTANGASYRTQLHRWIGVEELGGWDEILPSNTLMNAFIKEGKIATTGRYDSRLYESIFFQCDYYNDGTGRVYGWNYDDWFSDDKGIAYNRPAFRKFMPTDYAALKTNRCAINIPLMRYANVLLMKAEVLNEQNHPAQAIPLINDVRDIHGDMPPMTGTTQEAVRAQIEHERMIEFALENWRWYDLRRWGKLKEVMNGVGRTFDTQKNAFYPVPLTEINSNDEIN
ncbi:MAG: RagB/SusD family nutrient uptake outer membrane protein [Methanoculleus sp.]|nr:RagB/SusD family nutrient uptake outer membrane protein [Paludibacter sp.]MDD4197807.1 RagB/SusD family nutrient uptake outer membrane protein [Paludibacter sp.]MDD4427849.1 RagB/SusD family nutrient uptake outer membrane protein [Paludibacter sp.]